MKKIWLAVLLPLLLTIKPANAVDYVLPDLDDRPQAMDQYLGKWVVVNYWASWCGTCQKELPDLTAFYQVNRHRNIMVIGINFEEIDASRLRQAVTELAIPFPVLRSIPVRNTPLGPVPALPTTYIINPDGKVIAGEVGIVSRQHLEDYINQQNASGDWLAQKP